MPEPIPLDVLFGNPERTDPSLSPDARQLAWLAPVNGVLNVHVAPYPFPEGGVAATLDAATVVTDDRDRGIRVFAWAMDSTHLLYLQDRGGDENWRLYDVDVTTGVRRDLTPFEGAQAQLVAMSPRDPKAVLVALNLEDERFHDVYRVDLGDGSIEKVASNEGFAAWVADADLAVRGATRERSDGAMELLVRDSPDTPWRTVLEAPPDDALTTEALCFSLDGATLYVLSSVGFETSRLVALDVATGDATTVVEDPDADVTSATFDPVTREPLFATSTHERLVHHPVDPEVRATLERLRSLDAGDLTVEIPVARTSWLVTFHNAAGPRRFVGFDTVTGEGTTLFFHQPSLERYELAPVEPFSMVARDGLTLHGYLTFPLGVPREALPTVLWVHGGPWGRDRWAFDPFVQFLANRGYLCVQVNFRGSTGYGKSFVNAGDREWGAAMHDDLCDAMDHVVSAGYADPARVAVFGGSYGGYAALAAVTFTPERFACAVDVVGPSNLVTLIETIPPYWTPMIELFHRRVGDPEKDRDFLWSRSPLSRAADIVRPLLIAQGKNDPRVKQEESEQIVAALREAGIPHEYLLFEDEGHGFAKPQNRLAFMEAAEAFFAKHLAPAV